jgi:hypothetical protein
MITIHHTSSDDGDMEDNDSDEDEEYQPSSRHSESSDNDSLLRSATPLPVKDTAHDALTAPHTSSRFSKIDFRNSCKWGASY